LGFFTFQPSELAKLALCLYLAKLFKTQPNFLQLAVVLAILGLLIMAQPDMGTFLVLFSIAIGTYIGSGGKISPLLISLPVMGCLAGLLIIVSPYRASRLKTYLDMSHDPLGSSYQVRQSLIGLGTGGLTGSGLGQSRQKFDFLPEATTDSIFAVVGEELGFIGAITIVSIFTAIGLVSLSVARQQKNKFAQNLMIGLTVWLIIQAFINISATVALVPFTGIPLTFISYGRTALLSSLFAMGIMIHIARQTK
jgi:cell division protein FtsW